MAGTTDPWVFWNGQFCRESHVAIPLSDRGFQFGDGIFTTVRVSEGRPEFLQQHARRMYRQAEVLGFSLPEFKPAEIDNLIHLNQADTGVWRLKIIATAFGEQRLARCLGQHLMTLTPFKWIPWMPIRLEVYPYPIERPLSAIKTLSYLDYLQVRQYALQQGRDDAIVCDRQQNVLETSRSNLFWIDAGCCYVPHAELPYLKGIFFQMLRKEMCYSIQEVCTTVDQLPRNAHLYTCNAMTHIQPVISIQEILFSRNTDLEEQLQLCISHLN